MADLNLLIDLTPELPVYEPGTQLKGEVTITSPSGAWKAEHIELVLFWRTSGIGTRDTGVGASLQLCEKGTEIQPHFSRAFEVTLPLHPYSYNGRLIKIDWYVGLRVKKGWLSKQEIEFPIQLRPAASDAAFAGAHGAVGFGTTSGGII